MHTRDEIIQAVADAQRDGSKYWSAFDTDAFFAKPGEAWSPAENVRHLVKGIRPVTKALSTPRLLLRLMFGRARRPSTTYDELHTRYRGILEAGGRAGRFAPSPRSESDLEAWRTSILDQLARANADLAAAIGRWRDADLDRYQLPHPLLGKLTIREMLFFTIYHQHHHIAVCKRRLAESAGRTPSAPSVAATAST